MERRAVVLCTEPGSGTQTHYDLSEAAYPYWTVWGCMFALFALAAGMLTSGVAYMNAAEPAQWAALELCTVFGMAALVHSLFWSQCLRRHEAGERIVQRSGWNTHVDPQHVFAQVIENSKVWFKAVRFRARMIIVVDILLLIFLFGQSMMSLPPSVEPLLFLLFIAPSSIMVMVDYRKANHLANAPTQLEWLPNMLGWPGVVRYDEDM